MSETVRVTVIGAGAAGLMASISAARHGARALLLEGMAKPGAKILASGGTRCNLTHDEVFPENYNGGSRRVVARLLRELGARATRDFFERLGVATKLEPTGKVFPVSDSAVTVRDALLAAASREGVELRCGARVSTLAQTRGQSPAGFLLHLETGETLSADRLILSTGGLSYPSTGSRGDGLRWCEALGHTLVPAIPALVPLTTNDADAHALSGLTLEAELVLRRGVGGKQLYSVAGSFLFTHQGASGPAALNLSRHFLRAREEGPAWVEASWLPGRSLEQAEKELMASTRGAGRARSVENTLAALVPRRLAEAVLARAALDGATPLPELTREGRRALARLLTAWPLQVTGTLGFDKAEVTAGGVELSEIDPSTMQSRKVSGLYLCGEILDVDGNLGGYNFQWAWSSGHVAGRGAAVPSSREGRPSPRP